MAIKENFNTIYRDLLQLKQIKDNAAEAIQKISESDVWSDEYKFSMRNKINADTISKIEGMREEMQPIMQALKAELEAPQKNFDLCSVKLQNALQLVTLAKGRPVSKEVEESIVAQLSDEIGALEILRPMFGEAGMHIAAMEAEQKIKAVIQDANFVDNIDDALYYASMTASPDGGIEKAISIAKGFAYTKGIEIDA